VNVGIWLDDEIDDSMVVFWFAAVLRKAQHSC